MATLSPKNFSQNFATNPISIDEIHAQGGKVILVPLAAQGNRNPSTYTVTCTAAVAANDEVIILDTATGEIIYLYEGMILKFGSVSIVIAQTIKLTDAGATVACQPASGIVSINATASTWGGLLLQGLDKLPLDLKNDEVERGDLTYGLQKSQVITGVMCEFALEFFANTTDLAVWSIVFASVTRGEKFFCYADASADGVGVYGKALANSLNFTGDAFSLRKGSTTIKMQAPFSPVPARTALSTAQKTDVNAVRALLGLSVIV